MPVIVVGADTRAGMRILEGVLDPVREVRAFVSDDSLAAQLKSKGVKVALGDVSDESHVEAAASGCFSAILVTTAATDDRVKSFASTPESVLQSWGRAVANSDVSRVIWVADIETPTASVREVARVDLDDPEMVAKVVALDDAQMISSDPSI
jgi:putative NADH-flavin reductase